MIPTVLGVAILVFMLMHIVPGDPVEVLLGDTALPADRQAMREALGLHLPMWEQFQQFFIGLIHWDLGESFYNGRSVVEMIGERIPATFKLALVAVGIAIISAGFLGLWAATHKNKWQDKLALTCSMLLFSMPSFWLGPVLMIIFGLKLNLLPINGNEQWSSIILPAITLGAAMAAMTARLLRTSLLEVFNNDYIKTVRAKGGDSKLVNRHALRNAMLPVVTIVFLQAGALLTGAILTEAVFSWPGIGSLIVESIVKRDYPVVQGVVLFITLVYMLMVLISDIVYGFIDPRVRYNK